MMEERQAHRHAIGLARLDGVNPGLVWEGVDVNLRSSSVRVPRLSNVTATYGFRRQRIGNGDKDWLRGRGSVQRALGGVTGTSSE